MLVDERSDPRHRLGGTINRTKVLALFACFIALAAPQAAVAEKLQHYPGIGLSLYSSNTTALFPGSASVEYGDVYGGQLEWDGLFKPSWGYYLAGSFGTGSEKFTGTVTSQKGTFSDWDVQGGPQWVALFIENWYLSYGPALGYWSGKLKVDETGGTLPSSQTGKNFNSFGVGGRLMFGSSCPGFGVQGSICNFIGWGSGTDGGNKFEETNHRWQYCIGARYTF